MTAECNGMCIDSAEIGVPGYGIAYPHPECPLHGFGPVAEYPIDVVTGRPAYKPVPGGRKSPIEGGPL